MKMAFLLTQLESGGAQSRVLETAELLRDRGHTVDVFFFYVKREAFPGRPKVILSDKRSGVSLLAGALRLRRALRRGGYDVFIANTAPACILGCTAAMLAGVRNRVAVQTQPPSRLNPAYRLLDRLVGSSRVYRVNIANSRWTFDQFRDYPERYRKRLRVVEDGIQPKAAPETRDRARALLGSATTEFRFITVGRLSEQKNQSVLLKAMQEVPDATLAIVGDGPLRERLAQSIAEMGLTNRVRLLGEMPGDVLALQLRASDAFVFPSRWETFGLVNVEAASAGLPIISSDIPVHREVLGAPNDDSGPIYVAPDDVAGWSSAMTRLVRADRAWISAAREAGLAIAARHSLDRHVDKLLAAAAS